MRFIYRGHGKFACKEDHLYMGLSSFGQRFISGKKDQIADKSFWDRPKLLFCMIDNSCHKKKYKAK